MIQSRLLQLLNLLPNLRLSLLLPQPSLRQSLEVFRRLHLLKHRKATVGMPTLDVAAVVPEVTTTTHSEGVVVKTT
jgi:hypothetical protein